MQGLTISLILCMKAMVSTAAPAYLLDTGTEFVLYRSLGCYMNRRQMLKDGFGMNTSSTSSSSEISSKVDATLAKDGADGDSTEIPQATLASLPYPFSSNSLQSKRNDGDTAGNTVVSCTSTDNVVHDNVNNRVITTDSNSINSSDSHNNSSNGVMEKGAVSKSVIEPGNVYMTKVATFTSEGLIRGASNAEGSSTDNNNTPTHTNDHSSSTSYSKNTTSAASSKTASATSTITTSTTNANVINSSRNINTIKSLCRSLNWLPSDLERRLLVSPMVARVFTAEAGLCYLL